MKQTKFKVLMHWGFYTDANLLDKGIYTCEIPFIYSQNETIESMIKRAENIQDKMGSWHVSDEYFKNLKQCELIDIIIL